VDQWLGAILLARLILCIGPTGTDQTTLCCKGENWTNPDSPTLTGYTFSIKWSDLHIQRWKLSCPIKRPNRPLEP